MATTVIGTVHPRVWLRRKPLLAPSKKSFSNVMIGFPSAKAAAPLLRWEFFERGTFPLHFEVPEAMSGVEAATSPSWQDADGVLARVRGDAAVVGEIISLRGLQERKRAASSATGSQEHWHGYWITLSASNRIDCGTVKPSALAVLKFKAIWKLTGARTGGLVGFSPLRMRSTKDAERRVMFTLLVP